VALPGWIAGAEKDHLKRTREVSSAQLWSGLRTPPRPSVMSRVCSCSHCSARGRIAFLASPRPARSPLVAPAVCFRARTGTGARARWRTGPGRGRPTAAGLPESV
jgi:hypothetical protein